jgi:hypothetical protein
MNRTDELNDYLRESIESLVSDLYPNAIRKGNKYILGDVYGSPGKSAQISLAGKYAGVLRDWNESETYTPLGMISAVHGLEGTHLYAWAEQWLGIKAEPFEPDKDYIPKIKPERVMMAKALLFVIYRDAQAGKVKYPTVKRDNVTYVRCKEHDNIAMGASGIRR